MPAPAPPPEPEPEPETIIDSLPIELLTEEVFLRVRTPAALVRVAATQRSWRDAIAKDGFLARYRKRHKSSPFLGLYLPRPSGVRPWFDKAESIRFCRDDGRYLYDARNRAAHFGDIRRYQDHRLPDGDAFIPGNLVRKDCRLLDCHNGRLLLTRGDEALEVRSPLARQTILLPFPPDFDRFPDYLETCTCLLRGHDGSAAAAFRVVYLQHQRPRLLVRAVEYDSTRKTWHAHPWDWETLNAELIFIRWNWTPQEVMHAGHRIFCTYSGLTSAALMLDTSNMQFSILPLPSDTNFAIGEGEDNTCWFVESDWIAGRLRVWQLDEEKLVWDLNKDINMRQLLAGKFGCGCYRPRAISNGTALLCSDCMQFDFVVDLNTCSIKDKFEFSGEVAYLMHMPWPPAFSSLTTNGTRSPGRRPIVEVNMPVGSSVLASSGSDAPLQGSISERFSQQDHTAAVGPKSSRQNSLNLPHCANVEGADHGGSSNQSSILSSHQGLSAHAAVTHVLPTDASEPGHFPECITAHDTAMISQPDSRKAHTSAPQHERGEKVNQDLEDVAASIRPVEKYHAHGDLTLQSASASIPSSSKDRDRESAKKTSNEEKSVDVSPEISVRSKDQYIDDTLEGLSQQDLCIKCGKDGELLTCSDCSFAAHARCFGPSVTFEGTDFFYCPVCSCKKAAEDYSKAMKKYFEARKYADAYNATAQVSKQHDEQLNGVQPGAAKRDGHSNGSDMSKRNSIHENETYDLAHQDEEPHQPRKKQKMNAGGNCYPKVVLTEKVPFQNSGPASMNKHSVLQDNRKMQVEDPEKKHQEGDKEARKEAGKRRKRSSVRPQKRYSNPIAPTGRRKNLPWTEKEEAGLREAMAKFAPQNGAQIPWTQILEYGSNVFHKTRLPDDLRVKWRSMNKCSGY